MMEFMSIVDRFPGVNILVAGDVMLDRYWWGDVTRISPEAPVPVVKLKGDSTSPGGAANVAANVSGLGSRSVLFGAVGSDAEADELDCALKGVGIDPTHLERLPGRSTIVKTRIVAHSQQVVRIDREEILTMTPEEEARIIAAIEAAIPDIDIILISDYGKGFLTDAVLRILIDSGNTHNKPVLVDPKGKKFRKYAGATLLTPNQREAAESCALHDDMPNLVNIAGNLLISEIGLENVLITQGERGMTLFRPDRDPVHIPATAQETYDVTGAGDTVIATIGVAHGAGADMLEAARIANIAAGMVVQQVGTTAITREHLAEAIGG